MTIYFASLRLCVKLGSQRRRDAKIKKDHICEKHSTTNLFCEMVLVTDSHKSLSKDNAANDIELLLSDGSVHPYKGVLNFADAKIDPITGTMTIETTFPNPDNNLRSGQFSKVRALIENQKGAIAIPQKAVTELQGIFQVFIIDNENKIQVRIVEVVAKVGQDWVINKGLNVGDKVAIVGSLFIQPGSVVTPVPYSPEAKKAQ